MNRQIFKIKQKQSITGYPDFWSSSNKFIKLNIILFHKQKHILNKPFMHHEDPHLFYNFALFVVSKLKPTFSDLTKLQSHRTCYSTKDDKLTDLD